MLSKEIIYDTKSEQIIIGLMLVDVECRKQLVTSLRPEDFVSDRHKRIFIGLRVITEQNLTVSDPVLIQTIQGSYGGIDYIRKLREVIGDKRVSIVENLHFHLKRLRYSTAKYELKAIDIPRLLNYIDDESVEPDELKREIRSLSKYNEILTGKTYSETGISAIEDYRIRKHNSVGFRSTGFDALDNGINGDELSLTVGVAPGTVGIISARPSVGKTIVGTQLARRINNAGYSVNYCCWEMKPESIKDILACQWINEKRFQGEDYPNVSLKRIVQGEYNDHYAVLDALESIFGSNTFHLMDNPTYDRHIYDKANRNIYSVRDINDIRMDVLEEEISNVKADVWVFDLWERLLASTNAADIAIALSRMQWMANHYKKCFIILQQINREYSKSFNKSKMITAPKMEDIKNSGAFEEVADWILTLHRPGLYRDIPDNTIEMYCRKQRLGPWPWAVSYNYNGAYSSIYGKGVRIPVHVDDEKESQDGGAVF